MAWEHDYDRKIKCSKCKEGTIIQSHYSDDWNRSEVRIENCDKCNNRDDGECHCNSLYCKRCN